MNEYTASNDYRNYLAHYGVKGMKWGVRRYETYESKGKGIGGARRVQRDLNNLNKQEIASNVALKIAKEKTAKYYNKGKIKKAQKWAEYGVKANKTRLATTASKRDLMEKARKQGYNVLAKPAVRTINTSSNLASAMLLGNTYMQQVGWKYKVRKNKGD